MQLRLVACAFEGVHNGGDLFNDPPHRGGNAAAEVVSRGSDSRTRLDPRPVIVVQANSPGNKARKGREAPAPADLVETLANLASFHPKERGKPMLDISRQWVAESMKHAARARRHRPRPGPPLFHAASPSQGLVSF